MTAVLPATTARSGGRLIDQFEYGLDAPICLTWELTYACNLACVHCLSSSGRRDPRELSTAEAEAVIDELQRMQVFYVNVGGGEPTVRPDFWHLLDYAIGHDVGVKFSTNGVKLDKARAAAAGPHRLRRRPDLPGRRHRRGQRRRPRHRLLRHRHPGAGEPGRGRDEGLQGLRRRHPGERRAARRVQGAHRPLRRPAADHPASARRAAAPTSGTSCTPPRPSSASSTPGCWPTATSVLTGDSFFHLSAFGEALPGLNLCGAGRVVCLIDPVGDVYACPFAIHENFLAGNVRDEGGFQRVWQQSASCSPTCAARRPAAPARSARTSTPAAAAAWRPSSSPACRSTAPTPSACRATARRRWPPATPALVTPRSHLDHSHTGPVRGQPTLLGMPVASRRKICDESPLAGLDLR